MRREARSALLNTSGASDGNPQHQAPVTHLLIILRERPCLTCQRKMRRKHPFCYHQTHNLTYDLACSLCFLLCYKECPFSSPRPASPWGSCVPSSLPFPGLCFYMDCFPLTSTVSIYCVILIHTHTHTHTYVLISTTIFEEDAFLYPCPPPAPYPPTPSTRNLLKEL